MAECVDSGNEEGVAAVMTSAKDLGGKDLRNGPSGQLGSSAKLRPYVSDPQIPSVCLTGGSGDRPGPFASTSS